MIFLLCEPSIILWRFDGTSLINYHPWQDWSDLMNGDNENNGGLSREIIDITDALLIRWLHTLAMILPALPPAFILMTRTQVWMTIKVIQSDQVMTHWPPSDVTMTSGDVCPRVSASSLTLGSPRVTLIPSSEIKIWVSCVYRSYFKVSSDATSPGTE